jgi:uncharacterized heparinase superfamily protein
VRRTPLLVRARGKPPRVILRRLAYEVSAHAERYRAPWRARRFSHRHLLRACGAPDIDGLWSRLAARPYPAHASPDVAEYRRLCPGDETRIQVAAEDALAHRVRLMGPDVRELGPHIDWLKDYRGGASWPRGYMRDITYVNPADESDVKIPWELSRAQWLLPAGQAFLLTRDERYAEGARAVLDDWIAQNPYAQTVNWSCTMEAALRILSWTWLFRAFHDSRAWRETGFRERFLSSLYLHGDFTERHIELSDVNGNHCTADAAGLVFAGLFFDEGKAPARWLAKGWSLLVAELPRQVYADGVDFEASTAYHRLVTELFFLPALYRERAGLGVPAAYRERVSAMARFTATYTGPDGRAPLWGDADDARALPLGGQTINDHRYLTGLVGTAWSVPDLLRTFSGDRSEVFWTLGAEAAAALPQTATPPSSRAFGDGGFYVMRNAGDHVFVDCGRVGLADRGGHGHNDCLSFEAVLDGVRLISDCGAFTYTGSFEERNFFRSTVSHNTPIVDGQEINRMRPELLWALEYDAKPELRRFETGEARDIFVGAHVGYRRLAEPVAPVRTIELDHRTHGLRVEDTFEGRGRHRIEVPLHLAPGVSAEVVAPGVVALAAGDRCFRLEWSPADGWELERGKGRISPSYGVALPCVRLSWRREGELDVSLSVRIAPERQ